MFKTFSITVIACLGLFSFQSYAQQVNLKLTPKASKLITNHYAWTLNATCKIQANQPNKIRVSIIQNTGKVNGRALSQGQATSMIVRNNQNISVSAEPGAKVNLINLGEDTVQASCST